VLGGRSRDRKLGELFDCQCLIAVVIVHNSVPHTSAYCYVFFFAFILGVLGSAGLMAQYIKVAFASWSGRGLLCVWYWWLEFVW